jgi:porin
MMRKLLLLSLLAAILPLPSIAAEAPNYAEDTLTGDWGGTRSAMAKKGVTLDLGYKVDLVRNTGGGIERGGRPMSHVDLKLAADFEKLTGWSGGSGYVNFIQDHGGKVNARQVGSLTGVSNIEVAAHTNRLLHAWLQQEFADGRGALLMGLYPIDSEFATIDSAGVFVQPPYGATADIALTRGPSIFNTSSFGFRGKWFSADRSAYVMGAVLDGIPGEPSNPRGTHIRFNKGDGIMSIVEIGLKPGAARPAEPAKTDAKKDEAKDDAPELIEKYAAGLWRYSSRVADQLDTNPDGSPVNRQSWGWFALAEKTLYQAKDGRDLAGFVRISGTDGDSTSIKQVVNLGIRIKALLPGRSDDVFGLAYTRASLSSKWRSAQLALAAPTDTTAFEDAWEATYRIQAGKWLAVQPVIQRINHPGGLTSRGAASILGARVELTF